MATESLPYLAASTALGLVLSVLFIFLFGKAPAPAHSSTAKRASVFAFTDDTVDTVKRRGMIQRRLAKLQRLLGRTEEELEVRGSQTMLH